MQIWRNKSVITNRKVHIGKIQVGKYQLETTIRKNQMGEMQIGEYKSEIIIRKIHSKKTSEITNRKTQLGTY